jgi:hypothetical protein
MEPDTRVLIQQRLKAAKRGLLAVFLFLSFLSRFFSFNLLRFLLQGPLYFLLIFGPFRRSNIPTHLHQQYMYFSSLLRRCGQTTKSFRRK